jgi:hypothetical protein
MNGKGSQRRPRLVPREEYEKNWDRAFGDLPCVQCGNCCRVGGTCDWLNLSRYEKYIREGKAGWIHDADFEGTCPELQDNGQCGVILRVLSGELDDILHPQAKPNMKALLRGICTAPELRSTNHTLDKHRPVSLS